MKKHSVLFAIALIAFVLAIASTGFGSVALTYDSRNATLLCAEADAPNGVAADVDSATVVPTADWPPGPHCLWPSTTGATIDQYVGAPQIVGWMLSAGSFALVALCALVLGLSLRTRHTRHLRSGRTPRTPRTTQPRGARAR
jgi:hypothetical protein